MVQRKFDLHLPGLIRVLAENLYQSNHVGLRELLQNAHDSAVRRRTEKDDSDFEPRIDVSIDRRNGLLAIRDNGAGMTAQEIEELLATIGRSGTRELREQLELIGRPEAHQMIGCFGLGFLSAFMLASEITVTTRANDAAEALCFYCAGDEQYELSPAARDEVGTTVELRLKPEVSYLLDQQRLVQCIRKYGDFLPTPVFTNDDSYPVNEITPPWQQEDPLGSAREYIERTFREDPISIFLLCDWRVDLGHDNLTVPISGFLWVPRTSSGDAQGRDGELKIYIRRMLIVDGDRDMLPKHAFVRGVLDSPVLQPTASRESIVRDETYDNVCTALEEQFTAELKRVASRQPAVWKEIVFNHTGSMLGWADEDPDFYQQVEQLLPLPTSRGRLTLPQYLEGSGERVFCVGRQLGSLQERILSEAHGLPTIDASSQLVARFLEKYAVRHPDIQLVQLDGHSEHLFQPVAEGKFAELLAYYRKKGIQARIAAFRPPDIPSVLICSARAQVARDAQEALNSGDLPRPIAALMDVYVEQTAQTGESMQGVFVLNASCAVVRRLIERPLEDEEGKAVLRLLYQQARLFSGRMLSTADACEAFRQSNRAIEELLR